MRFTCKALCAAAFVAGSAVAQAPLERDLLIMAGPTNGTVAMSMGQALPGPQRTTIGFVSSVFGEKTVTGAPYSAEGTTGFTRTLFDGTRITRTGSSLVYRDGQGRTRQEHSMEILGALPASTEPSKTVTIIDPVAKAVYILDPAAKVATQLPLPGGAGQNVQWVERGDQTTTEGKREVFENRIRIEPGAGVARAGLLGKGDFRTESLGKRAIEGVAAEGTRTTSEIPIDQIGNDRPIIIVTETWYSPELQVVVSSRTTDPMSGDTSYRLTNINRAEPPASLFQVPPDYTLKQDPEHTMIRKMVTTPKPKP